MITAGQLNAVICFFIIDTLIIFDKNFFESRTIKKARKRVKFVVMDMYSPYIDLIKK